jgi:hypothetical protein
MPFALEPQTNCPFIIPEDDGDDGHEESDWASSVSEDEEDDDAGEDEEHENCFDTNTHEASHPEDTALPLPSRLGHDVLKNPVIEALAKEEVELRIVQATGALQQLRLALGLKSALFRNLVRGAKTQRTKTRAWRSLKPVEAAVRLHAQEYRIARQALLQLGASPRILARFPVLSKEDCKMSGDVVEENRLGQRSEHVSWVWRADWGAKNDKNAWEQESESMYTYWHKDANINGMQFNV